MLEPHRPALNLQAEGTQSLEGSLGLILVTPITSLVAGAFAQREERLKAVANEEGAEI